MKNSSTLARSWNQRQCVLVQFASHFVFEFLFLMLETSLDYSIVMIMPSYHRSLACPHQMTFSSTFLIGNFVVKYTLMIFLRIDCKVVMKFITHSFQTTESPWLTRIPRHRHRSLFSIVINMSLLRSLQRRWSSAVRQPKAFAKSSYEAARLLNHSWQKGETWWSFCNKFSSTANTNSNWQRCYYSELLPHLTTACSSCFS